MRNTELGQTDFSGAVHQLFRPFRHGEVNRTLCGRTAKVCISREPWSTTVATCLSCIRAADARNTGTRHEYRVWCETGDLVFVAGVSKRHGKWRVEGYRNAGLVFVAGVSKRHGKWRVEGGPDMRVRIRSSEYEACVLASVMADREMTRAIHRDRIRNGCMPKGVMSAHGYSVQVVDYDV